MGDDHPLFLGGWKARLEGDRRPAIGSTVSTVSFRELKLQ